MMQSVSQSVEEIVTLCPNDLANSSVFSQLLKTGNDGDDVTCGGSEFRADGRVLCRRHESTSATTHDSIRTFCT